jgi:hypothetical protein
LKKVKNSSLDVLEHHLRFHDPESLHVDRERAFAHFDPLFRGQVQKNSEVYSVSGSILAIFFNTPLTMAYYF